jgi:hypothetical protein
MTNDTARRIDVFFYGLFMDDALLREKGVNPQKRRVGFVENFCLVIGERATLVPFVDAKVYGVLFSLTHREVDDLYSEASVNTYRPEAISVRLADRTVIPALCFNLPTPPMAEERNARYVTKLKELARQIGLPRFYVSSIQ